ncbi:thioredoxin TrxC [Paradevosia shaoguanensis]|uniref:thioredoxin TrxC n=1 Tax=Paradevosia shaoguanensis TaxID=1335043 RepID=UPI00086F037D|nr:MAG: thioredoxin [Pelagibacterium sp. SCN 64-44]ODU82200.1 MAG: thioredoxin [Pelagibacterium sp. SCN 63-17]
MSDLPHVVCSFCGATNRVPSSGNARSAKCGKCGVALFSGVPADVPAAILEKQIAKSDIPVVVDIWAPWCGPCRVMAPQFEAAARQAEPALRFVKLNSDENQEIASRLGIRGIPTMIMFKGGKEVARVSGAMSSSDILKWTRDEA